MVCPMCDPEGNLCDRCKMMEDDPYIPEEYEEEGEGK